ncbi:3-hydroxyacyl-CoA dehydrogenase NAD-binding domain-containing protein [Noviherbaspirillum denitrificans]|uniref:3-hydroxyacyl-CoA dehydrogenase n=1 Tax=Noviherbaspirillum denitrificans TaxID=1968433 RepID=A0A254TF37_9BURK|nr:3-hydroxyacyl-CoA dehydrogenase NAD-binding domain-containing protein [Noviherbaspirillum denitrificans]OWW21145.1 3-hydroxyacyl-CoA dehydrogenase [Noviherbaspirillum denitrificans]
MTACVRVERDGNIAVVVIDNPPINAGSVEVRRGLVAAIDEVNAQPEVFGIVIMGAGNTFIAGSDLHEFGQPIAEPSLPAVISAIETCEKPVVAALHGAALGGGFELALGCDARVALSGTVLGLPEVTLGIIPGAGGTQRLPRLTGIPEAISLVCSGERVRADAARMLGMVDIVVTDDLRGAAVACARKMEGRKARIRDRAVPACDDGAIEKASAAALRAGKNRPAVRAAIDAIVSSATHSFDDALASERAAFQALRVSREARALRHQFFAERDAAKHPAAETATARPLQRVAVIGAGTMGAGIAIAALEAGFDVVLLEQDEAALVRGVDRIRSHYQGRVDAGKMDTSVAREREGRLKASVDWTLVAGADLVIEAVFEDLKVKQEVFRRLDSIARPGAILASNTSYTDLDAIAASTSRPQDVIGLHFFSPAHVMRLLEIVRGAATSQDVLATGLQLAKRLRKQPVVSANAFGFIGNRIYAAYRRQCEFMLEEGASPQQIDAALEAFGFAMGPFAVADLSGLDIAWRMRQSLASTREPQARYVHIPDRLCEAGRLGRKTGAGYYLYDQTGGARRPDPEVDRVIDAARLEKGIAARVMNDEEIVRRSLLAMANEAALLLAEGIARQASDIDVVLVNGYGFPKWEGGPMFWARERGVEALEEDLDWLAGLSGPGFVRGDIRQLFSAEQRT